MLIGSIDSLIVCSGPREVHMADTPSPAVELIIAGFRSGRHAVGRLVINVMTAFYTASQQEVGLFVALDVVQNLSGSFRLGAERRNGVTVAQIGVTQRTVPLGEDVEQLNIHALIAISLNHGNAVIVIATGSSGLAIFEQGSNRIGIGNSIRRPATSSRELGHILNVGLPVFRSIQEERFLKGRIIQLAVIHVIRSLVVDQVKTVSPTQLLEVGSGGLIVGIHAVARLFIADGQQQFFEVIISFDVVCGKAIFLSNVHVDERAAIRENFRGITGNHVDFAVYIGLFPGSFRQSCPSLGHIRLQEFGSQLQEGRFLHVVAVISEVRGIDQVDLVAACQYQRVFYAVLSRGNKVQLQGGVQSAFNPLIRHLQDLIHIQRLISNRVHDQVYFFGSIQICIGIVGIHIRSVPGGRGAGGSFRALTGITAAAEQQCHQHHCSQHQSNGFFHSSPPNR